MIIYQNLQNVLMIRIQQLGPRVLIIIFSFLFISSGKHRPRAYFSKIHTTHANSFSAEFRDYNLIDSTSNFELNAVLCSFLGDHASSIKYATKRAPIKGNHVITANLSSSQINNLRTNYLQIISSLPPHSLEKEEAIKMLRILNTPTDVKEVFNNKNIVKAIDFILSNAINYNYLLINESHYNSQNRAFTKSLLKPLWSLGYRYLALETLSYDDPELAKRGYPVMNTGYYTQESVFGNLVREALRIGYKIIPYEYDSKNSVLRDSMQAVNIYKQTYKADLKGKVLVHAGYSHIAEAGDRSFKPMGLQLKGLLQEEILTVDQESMTELLDSEKRHPYYNYAIDNFSTDFPFVVVDSTNQSIVDPINSIGIDIQVYHPFTTYVQGRPKWIIDETNSAFQLPKYILKYKGYLLQAIKHDELSNAVPIDQFVISENKSIVLPRGIFLLRLIDKNGSLTGTIDLTIK